RVLRDRDGVRDPEREPDQQVEDEAPHPVEDHEAADQPHHHERDERDPDRREDAARLIKVEREVPGHDVAARGDRQDLGQQERGGEPPPETEDDAEARRRHDATPTSSDRSRSIRPISAVAARYSSHRWAGPMMLPTPTTTRSPPTESISSSVRSAGEVLP